MKKTMVYIAVIVIAAHFLYGCSEKTYHGRYVTIGVPYEPFDEFEHEGWVVISFEVPGKRPEEGKIFEFWLFRGGKKTRELWLSAKIVGKRMFFLQEQVGENVVSHASFNAPPTYEAVKERIKTLLASQKLDYR